MTALGDDAAQPIQVHVGAILDGRYEVKRLVGRGAMGVVVEARHMGHGQRVAVKILHERHKLNEEAVARFTQEGHAAARVRGEHSVRLFDTGVHDGCPYLVMELLVGRDLETVIAEGAVPFEVAATYLLQACEGMAEVHAHGMVHRDLKPSNLFLTERPDGSPLVKVLDFGIAKGARGRDQAALVQTQTLVALGTPLYMSPEQIRSSQSVDARADVWSLGAIFFELVAGRPAFGGNSVTHITAQVLERDPPPLSSLVAGLPPELDAIVSAALRKHPDERLVDVAALAACLEPYAGPSGAGAAARSARILQGSLRQDPISSPPVAHDDGLGGTIRFDRRRRSRWIRTLVAALALASGILIALAILSYQSAKTSTSQPLAQRGLRSTLTRTADALGAPTVTVNRGSAAPPVDIAASATAIGRDAVAPIDPSGTPPVGISAGPTSSATPPLTAPPVSKPERTSPPSAPTVTSPPSARPAVTPDGERPFNPFSERN